MLRVAVVGAGPSGIYAADALTKDGAASVDIFDRLPTPYGLVRYGVAPDHLKIKSTTAVLHKVLDRPQVRFLGNIALGTDITVADLRELYDAVIYAHGAAVDRPLGIPGEDLAGSFSATEFVAWYSGHPDALIDRFTLDAHSVVVIGVGNVAIDVTRILAKTADDLRHTDIPDHVLDVLAKSAVTDIHLVGRRGPAQAKFTSKELRELGELANADVIVRPDELVLDEASHAALASDSGLRRNVETLTEWSARTPEGRPRRIHLRFLLRPVEVLATADGAATEDGAATGQQAGTVGAIRMERTALDGTGNVMGTGQFEDIPAQMVLRSVGYKGHPLPDLPFDERSGVIPNTEGRVLRDGQVAAGEYVAGWIKRGPTGVIGTNKGDANETVRSLLADVEAGVLPTGRAKQPQAVLALLEQRGVQYVDWTGWQAIDAAEIALGQLTARARAKIHRIDEMIKAAFTGRRST